VSADPHDLAEQLDAVVLAVFRTTTADRAQLSLTAAAVLARLQRKGPARLTDLATGEGITQPSMTTLVARLVAQGLVDRAVDPADRRAVVLTLTPAGAELLARRRADRTDRLAPHLAELSPDERDRIAAALPALTQLAGAVRRSRTPAEVTR
jgi:DNA-binding MarR family transcriptional regulator